MDLVKYSVLLSEEPTEGEGWGVRRMTGIKGDVGVGWWGAGGGLEGVGGVVGEGGKRMFVGECRGEFLLMLWLWWWW